MKKKTIAAATVGLAVGTGLGMMYAPKKGIELRQDLKELLNKIKDKIQKIDIEETKEELSKILDKISKELEELDAEKVKKIAKEKADNIKTEIEEIISAAIETKDKLMEEAATELKEKIEVITKEILNKLED